MDNTERLVDLFFKTINRQPGRQWHKRMVDVVNGLIDEGISTSIIEDAIIKDPDHIKDYAKAHRNNETNNILKKDMFYYHPALQIAPPPPVITVNPDGTFSKTKQEFFLRMKSCFTLENVLEYFYTRFPGIDRNQKRDIGAIEYLYNRVVTPAVGNTSDTDLSAIDLLLFTIDTASVLCSDEDNKLVKLLDLVDYVNNGLLVYQDKKEGCVHAGINHVV